MGFETLGAVSYFEIYPEIQTGNHLALRFQDFDEMERSPCGLSMGFDGKFRDFAHLGVDFRRGISSAEGRRFGFCGFVAGECGGYEGKGKKENDSEQFGGFHLWRKATFFDRFQAIPESLILRQAACFLFAGYGSIARIRYVPMNGIVCPGKPSAPGVLEVIYLRRDTSAPTNRARSSPAAPAMSRWLRGIFFPHSQQPPSHFPVVMRVLTDSMQGQVFMGSSIQEIPLLAKKKVAATRIVGVYFISSFCSGSGEMATRPENGKSRFTIV